MDHLNWLERDDIKAILADESLTPEERKLKISKEIIPKLSAFELKSILEMRRKNNNYRRKKKAGQKDDRIALFEFENISQNYMLQMGMIANVEYVMSRFDQYKGEHKDAISDFLQESYGFKDGDHMGAVADLFDEAISHLKPCEIPEITEPLKSQLRPSFEQLTNLYNFYNLHFDHIRMMTTAMFGSRPEFECVTYFHGLFNNQEEVDKYRMKEVENIGSEVYAIPVKETIVLQPFLQVKEKTVSYDPMNKNLEMMFIGNELKDRAEVRKMYNRMKNVERADAKKIEKITEYENQLSTLGRKEAASTTEEEEEKIKDVKRQLQMDLNKELSELSKTEGMISKVTVLSGKNKGTKYIPVTESEIQTLKSNTAEFIDNE